MLCKRCRNNLRENRRRRSNNSQPSSSSHSSYSSIPANFTDRRGNCIFNFISGIITFIAFISACFLTPWLAVLYIVIKTLRRGWVKLLELKFPFLEFIHETTPRTAVDTVRNQGIITLLLQVNGACQISLIKTRIRDNILSKTKKNGDPAYPHLKFALSSRWGRYGWVKGSEKNFSLDNQILQGHSLFKGRPISELNIQEYVSDVVSKLLPPELPPWQIIIVPTQGNQSYILIRLHHLYLSEDRLALGELLMLQEDSAPLTDEKDLQHLLSGTFHSPVVIPQVFQTVYETVSTHWQEILYQFDSEDALRVVPDLKTLAARFLIAVGVTAQEVYTTRSVRGVGIFGRELEKRNVNFDILIERIIDLLNPVRLVKFYFVLWIGWLRFLLSLPRLCLEFIRDIPVYLYWLYLGHFILQECWYVISIIYNAPRVLFEEIFLPEYPCNVHQLQTVSLCGRKVVSWSEPIPLELIEGIKKASDSSTVEVLLSATAASLRDYFEKVGFSVPDAVVATARFMPQQHLFVGSDPPGSCGMLCLPLPTNTPPNSPLVSLRALQASLYNARSKQAALYLGSLYQLDYHLFTTVFPSVFARACLYLLSRRYAVTLTQVDSMSAQESEPKNLIWGPKLERIMYWRPPQANVCLSLTLMSYAGKVQLGVMADAQLAPQHSYITRSFTDNIYLLASIGRTAPIPTT